MPLQDRTPTQERYADLDVLAGLEIPRPWKRDRYNHDLAIPFYCCSGKLASIPQIPV